MADLEILNMVIVTAMKDMDGDVDKDADVDGDRIHLLQPQRERRRDMMEAEGFFSMLPTCFEGKPILKQSLKLISHKANSPIF